MWYVLIKEMWCVIAVTSLSESHDGDNSINQHGGCSCSLADPQGIQGGKGAVPAALVN